MTEKCTKQHPYCEEKYRHTFNMSNLKTTQFLQHGKKHTTLTICTMKNMYLKHMLSECSLISRWSFTQLPY